MGASASGSGGRSSPAATSHGHAIRQGSSTARSPPGIGTVASEPARSEPGEIAAQQLSPHTVPSVP